MQQNIQYDRCNAHHKQFVQIVCLDCQNQSLACPLCIDIHHQKHDLISLKKFLSQCVPNLFDDLPDEHEFAERVKYLSQIYENAIEKMRKIIAGKIQQLQEYLQSRNQQLMREMEFLRGRPGVKIGEMVDGAKKMIKNGKKVSVPDKLLKQMDQLAVKTVLGLENATHKIIEIFDGFKEDHKKQSCILINSTPFQYTFSSKNKHPSLLISETNCTNIQFDNAYHTALIQPHLQEFSNEVTLSIVNSENKCVWIGICEQQVGQHNEFINTYKNKGMQYWIWQGGDQQQAEFYGQESEQHPYIGWNFDIGDKITIQLCSQSDETYLKFIKHASAADPQLKQFKTLVNKHNSHLYAAVALGDQGESIKIVNI